MAQIPDFFALGASAVPTPSYRRVQVDDSAVRIDEGIAGIGQTLEQTGEQQYARDTNLARAQANNAYLDHKIAVETLRSNVEDQVSTGQLPYQNARNAFDSAAAKIPVRQIPNLDEVGQTDYDRSVKRNVFTNQMKLDNTVELARRNDFKDQFTGALDKLGKLAGMPDADVAAINSSADTYREYGREAGIPAVMLDKALQNFKDQNWLNQATQRSMEAKDNIPALQQLRHDLTDPDGFYAGKLDTDKRNAVLLGVINSTSALQNRLDREQDKAEIHGQMALNRIDQQISSGTPATPQLWSAWADEVKGTSAASEFNQRLQEEQTIQSVLREPIDKQVGYVQQRQQELDQQGGSVHDVMMVHRLAAAVKANTDLMQSDPLVYDARRNRTDATPLDLTQMGTPEGNATIAASISDRVATLKSMRMQYGSQIPLAPLLPQEVGAVTSQLQNATPKAQVQLLGSLRGAMNDDQAYMAAMGQIAPHSPVTAIAGMMVSNSAPASTPAWFDQKFAPKIDDVAHVLSGDSLLNPTKATTGQQEKGELKSTVPMPPDGTPNAPGLRDFFFGKAKDLFRDRPELGEAYFAAFKAADAGLRAQKGDLKGEPDRTGIETQALKIALGNTINFNGAQVKVPDGMDPTQFKGYVNNAVAASVKAAGGKDDWPQRLDGYRLNEIGGVGTGRYAVMDGPVPWVRPDGKGPLTIDLRQQFGPSSAASQPPPAAPDNPAAMSNAEEPK